jgi:hypothetical protein
MAVYFDTPMKWGGRKLSAHLIADSLDELHEFAKKVGLHQTWFQTPPKASNPHYDV